MSQLLCKQLGIDVKDLTPGRLLYTRKRPSLNGNPDFNLNIRVGEPMVPGIAASAEATAAVDAAADPALLTVCLIPNLPSLVVVNSSLALFQQYPHLTVRGGCGL